MASIYYKRALFCLLLLATNTYSQIPVSGLVAWYPFCGNVLDKSNNNLNLTLNGPVPATDRFGYANAAYSFNGNAAVLSNVAYRTPPLPTDTSDFTYAAWFEADTVGNSIVTANGNINTNGYAIVTQGHNVAVYFGGVGYFLPTYITFHHWHHALLRKQGITYSFFLDTVITGSFNASFTPSPTTQYFAVGQDYTNGSGSFLGKIDDIAVYNRSLSDLEIPQLYHYNPNLVSAIGNDTIVCNGFSMTLYPTPSFPSLNYLWSTGSTDTSISVSSAGTYWFTISKPYGCTTSDTINVALGSLPVNIGNDTNVCIGDTFLISTAAPAGSSYLWSTGDTTATLSVHAPGIYSVHVLNGGCGGADTMWFGYSLVPHVYIGPDTTLCSGTPLTLQSDTTYSPLASYSWNTGAVTPSINPDSTGNYILGVLVDGCRGYDTARVTLKPTPLILFGPNASICTGDSIVLSGSGIPGSVYTWSTGDTVTSITVKTTGKYWLTGVTNGCMATDTISVTVNPIPPVHLGPDQSVCEGSFVTLTSSDTYSGASFLWNTGVSGSSLSVTTSGTYALTVTKNGCSGIDSVNVTILPSPVVALGSDAFFCSSSTYTLNSAQPSGATYLWSTGSTASSINITTPGLYGLVVTNNGCTGSDSIRLTEIKVPSINLGRDTALCEGYKMKLYIQGDQASYLWSDGSTGDNYSVSQDGPVWATISNMCGSASDTIVVKYGFCNIWFPSAFSPNGDGKNDIIRVRGSLGAYQEYRFTVFNRWGVVMFMTEDINKGWDGMYNNMEQGIGTYFYMISYKINNQTYTMKGDFELVR